MSRTKLTQNSIAAGALNANTMFAADVVGPHAIANTSTYSVGELLVGGTILLDNTGVITGPSSITSTAFVGALTGNASGTAATVTTAAQPAITSLGTLSTLTVDNVIINGTTIGHTSDTDLLTLASGTLTVTGAATVSGQTTSASANITGLTTSGTMKATNRLFIGDIATALPVSQGMYTWTQSHDIHNRGGVTWYSTHNSAGATEAVFAKGRSGSIGSYTTVQDGDVLGAITWCADDGTDMNSVAARISAAIDGTPGSNDVPGRLMFHTTADGGNNPAERMRITSAGFVGIGTTSPSTPLYVNGTVTATTFVGALTGNASGTAATVTTAAQPAITSLGTLTALTTASLSVSSTGNVIPSIITASGNAVGLGIFQSGAARWELGAGVGDGSGNFNLYSSLSGTTGIRLAVTNAGLVGIGTAAPANLLNIVNASGQTDAVGNMQIAYSGSGGVNSGLTVKNYHGTSQFMQWETYGLRIGSRILTNSGVGDIIFTAGADSEKMRIKAAGNVGIGTTAPSSRLEISSAGDNTNVIVMSQGGAYKNSIQNFHSGSASSARMSFFVHSASNTQANVMSLLGNGNVGIGLTPTKPFQVYANGGIQFAVHQDISSPSGHFMMEGGGGAAYLYAQGATNTNAYYSVQGTGSHLWFGVSNTGTQRMALTPTGLGINVSAPASLLEIKAAALNRANGIALRGSGANDVLYMYPSADNVATIEHLIDGSTTSPGVLLINPQGGNVGIGTSAPSTPLHVVGNFNLDGALDLDVAYTTNPAIAITHTGTGSATLAIFTQSASNLYNMAEWRNSSGTSVLNFAPSGNVTNTNNSYGAISDVKLKENIADASSQWDDIKAIKVRKFSFKTESSSEANKLGVIAQELESAGMGGLVVENTDRDPDTFEDLGTTTKEVKYSVLYMKAVKALQEAMARIEALETRITALEG